MASFSCSLTWDISWGLWEFDRPPPLDCCGCPYRDWLLLLYRELLPAMLVDGAVPEGPITTGLRMVSILHY